MTAYRYSDGTSCQCRRLCKGKLAFPRDIEDLGLEHKVRPVVVINNQVLYAFQPQQMKAYKLLPIMTAKRCPTHIGYGGAAGGAKSHFSRGVLSSVAQVWPGSTSILFRRTFPEVRENHINKFKGEVPESIERSHIYSYNGDEKCVTWHNGSRSYFGYLDDPSDVFRYQGPEYDVMIFEEATHYLAEQVKWLTSNRLRSTLAGTIPFCVYPSNPGNRGHQWYMRLFIDRDFDEAEGERPRDYVFVQAKLKDNLVLMKRDPGYAHKLNGLPEPWRSWMRDGDFKAGAGAALPQMSKPRHVIKPFAVPEHWPRYGSFDWGFSHPWSFGEWTVDEDGVRYKLQTITGRRDMPNEIADKIRAKVDVGRMQRIEAGHDVFHKHVARGENTPTIAEQFQEKGIWLTPANTDRKHGLMQVRRLLTWKDPDGEEIDPAIRFFDNKGNSECWKQLGSMVPDPDDEEDVLKVDADDFGRGGDDMYDETRYGCCIRMEAAESTWMNTPVRAWAPEVLAAEAERRRHDDTKAIPNARAHTNSEQYEDDDDW